MGVEHVVILVLENHSFDEYFGTFPDANGFSSSPESAFAGAWVPEPGSWTGPAVLPYRLSTFSSQQGHGPGCNHDAAAQHSYYAGGAMNGWSLQSAGNPVGCMGYYTADDIPYHWWLAQNFALCDNYYCSVLGPTEPNRLYLMTGTINTQAEFLNNPGPSYTPAPGWLTYADMLTAAGVSWRLYDDQSSPSTLPDGGDFASVTLDWELNALSYFSSWATLGNPAGPHYRPGLSYFLGDAAIAGGLPAVSWIVPQFAYTEHPPYTAADGALLMSAVTEALLASPDWETTALIITYDENDGHFDHVAPPQPPSAAQYPDEFIGGQSIGAGFRVPALVISPWTLGRGICSDPYDHTSTLMFLEDVTGVPCPNISAWRRQAFRSMSSIGFLGAGEPPGSVPARPGATALAQFAVRRYHANPGRPGGSAWAPDLTAADLVPQPQQWPPVPQGCQVIMTIPSYGKGQVQAQAGQGGGPATFPGALIVVVDGFEPAELTTQDALSPLGTVAAASPPTPACSTRIPQVTVADAGGNPVTGISVGVQQIDLDPGSALNQTQPGVPRRFTFSYALTFEDPESFFSFPAGTVQVLTVSASFTVDTEVTSSAELELVASDDPQFFHLFYDDTFYLSGELRVFPAVAGDSFFGVQLPSAADADDALSFITAVMATLTEHQGQVPGLPPGQVSAFDDLNQDEAGSSLPLSPADTATQRPVFSFALARVRLQADSSDPATVRVFFRSFRASSTSTAYETQYAYRSYPPEGSAEQPPPTSPPGTRIPLLGVGYGQTAGEYVTLPFFATQRIQLTNPAVPMTWQQDAPNVQVMQTGTFGVPSSGTVQAYFGCWLDINQPGVALFPGQVPGSPAQVDGPFDAASTQSIQQAFTRDMHQCLMAEISYDPIVIPNDDSPQYSAWLAQRNLGIIPAPNPGQVASRKVLGTFDIRATTAPLAAGVRPDELMLDWSGLPPDARASIYLPAVAADEILAAAGSMYGTQPFTRIDEHTVHCAARGITFLPIPAGSGNYAGLLDVELPATIRSGDQHMVVVSQVTNAAAAARHGDQERLAGRAWRKIAGTFQLSVPVSTRTQIRPGAERDLAILRWIFDAIAPADRWYPVMSRYLGALAGRIEGLGGDPAAIPASATGTWPGQPGEGPAGCGPGDGWPDGRHGRLTGKIDGLIFDRFGDFEGFILKNDRGEFLTFSSRRVEDLAQRAWAERIRVTVIPAQHDRHRLERIVLHRG